MSAVHDHLRRFPHARPSTLAYIEKRAETTERLKREIAARNPVAPARKSILDRVVSWLGRRA
jgi:hypothetical protein